MKKDNLKQNRLDKTRRLRVKLAKKTNRRFRLNIFRSNRYIFAQIIDGDTARVLVEANSKSIKNPSMTKTEQAMEVGRELAEKALKNKIDTVFFDRSYYKYHGRVKALAESARTVGLKI